MADKTIKVSDLSGQLIMNDDDVAKLIVTQHPALSGGPVQLDAQVSELEDVEGSTLDLVTFELHYPDAEEPEQIIMEVEAFNKLFTEGDVDDIIRHAKPTVKAGGSRGAAGAAGKPKINYATLDHAGTPKKGKVSEEEKRLVQENFDQINERLAAEGLRTIDLNNEDHVARYGLANLADERKKADAKKK